MKEYRFKVLREGDYLCSFNEKEMVICGSDGNYHIHRVTGIDTNEPNFYKNFEVVTIHKIEDISDNIISIKSGKEYRIYRVNKFVDGFPTLEKNFCIIVKLGVGKLEVYDSEEEITYTLPAKGDK